MAKARRDGKAQQQYYDFSLNSARAAQVCVGAGCPACGGRLNGLVPSRRRR